MRSVQRFLGFVEGRLRIALPRFWEAAIRDVMAYDRFEISFSDIPLKPDHTIPLVAIERSNMSQRPEEKKIELKLPGESLIVASQSFHKAATEFGITLSAFLARKRCYVAIYHCLPGRYSMWCIDRKTGEVLWRTDVWVAGSLPAFSGFDNSHVTQIMVDVDRVLVFGISSSCVYVEAFNARDGKSLFRFSTAY